MSDVLINTGIADDGTESGILFRELAAEEVDHAEFARRFRKIGSSGNPLKPSLYIGTMMAELYFALRGSPKQGVSATNPEAMPRLPKLLAEWSTTEIQKVARHLAVYHKSLVKPGPPSRYDLDAILEELGDIYASMTDFSGHRHDLDSSENSRFIQFCHAVLEPHCKQSESSLKALSRRWERIKVDASRPAQPVKRAPKRLLQPRKKQKLTVA